MHSDEQMKTLSELDEYQLVNSDQDLRGRPLMTASGERVGTIQRMLVDRDHERVAAVLLDDGRAVPIEEVEIRDGQAYIDSAGEMPAGFQVPNARAGTEERIPVAEEQLVVGKRAVERGHIRVRSHVVERPVHEQVMLREEHVEVERRPMNERVENADRLFQERTVEATEMAEEAVVGKQARVVEEVVVRKEEGERIEQIDDTVRRTEVDVDREPDTTGRR